MLFPVTPVRTRGKNLWEIRGIKAGIKKKDDWRGKGQDRSEIEGSRSTVSIDGQWPVEYTRSCISKPTPKEQYAHIHARSRLESNHEARSLSPWCALFLLSPIFFPFLHSWLFLWRCAIVQFSTLFASYRTHYHIYVIASVYPQKVRILVRYARLLSFASSVAFLSFFLLCPPFFYSFI